MALTLLHEMAHAAHFHTMADRPEDFFEDALVAEGGYEYESRIFGMVADIKYTNPPHGEWKQWQNITFLDQSAGAYPVIEVCRNTEKLSIKSIRHPFDAKFAERLLGDEWWEGKEKVARDRSAAAIGAGTDVAVESAGVVLASSDPRAVLSVISLSRVGYRKMIQNLVWGAGYNVLSVPLAAGVLAPVGFVLSPAAGAVLMSLSTVIVALNAQLLRRWRPAA